MLFFEAVSLPSPSYVGMLGFQVETGLKTPGSARKKSAGADKTNQTRYSGPFPGAKG